MTSSGAGQQGGVTLVLGGGGRVGIAYEAGVLRALRDVGSFDADDADLIIGTSAGSVAGAYLRLGRRPEDIAKIAYSSTPPNTDHVVTSKLNMVRAWSTPGELARRVIGSSSVVARSLVYSATPPSFRSATAFLPARAPEVLNRLFPGWLIDPEVDAVRTHIPADWPAADLWLVAFDIHQRKRVALGSRAERPPLDRAVMASCAVPGLFRPVRWGNRVFVDGGTTSVTNLDLAASSKARAVIAIAPMAFDPASPPGPLRSVQRRRANAAIKAESLRVLKSGAALLVIRPGGDELRHHSSNLLAVAGNEDVESSAYQATSALLKTPEGLRFLEVLHSKPVPLHP